MRRRITIEPGEILTNNDTLVGYRRGRQNFGEMRVKYPVPQEWGKAKFTLIASRSKETRASRNDDFNLCLQWDKDVDINKIKKSTLQIYRIGNCKTGQPERAITSKMDLVDAVKNPREIKFKDNLGSCAFKPPYTTLYFDFIYDAKKVIPKPDKKEKKKEKKKENNKNLSLKERVKKAEVKFTGIEFWNAYKRSEGRDFEYRISDDDYWCVDQSLWSEITTSLMVHKSKYVVCRYDCDDFMYALKGLAGKTYRLNSMGLVVDDSGQHAYNCIFVVENGQPEMKFFEPQQNKFVTRDYGLYKMDEGLFII